MKKNFFHQHFTVSVLILLCIFQCQAFSEGTTPEQILEWRKAAILKNDAEAQYHLGESYYEGDGVARDLKEAVKWYLASAEQGFSKAQVAVSSFYFDGDVLPKNGDEALKWARKAANQGDANGLGLVGLCYETGTGVKLDLSEAVNFYCKAADQGCMQAYDNLAGCYLKCEDSAKIAARKRLEKHLDFLDREQKRLLMVYAGNPTAVNSGKHSEASSETRKIQTLLYPSSGYGGTGSEVQLIFGPNFD